MENLPKLKKTAIERAVVKTYKKIEKAVTGAYSKIEDKFVDRFLTEDKDRE